MRFVNKLYKDTIFVSANNYTEMEEPSLYIQCIDRHEGRFSCTLNEKEMQEFIDMMKSALEKSKDKFKHKRDEEE